MLDCLVEVGVLWYDCYVFWIGVLLMNDYRNVVSDLCFLWMCCMVCVLVIVDLIFVWLCMMFGFFSNFLMCVGVKCVMVLMLKLVNVL